MRLIDTFLWSWEVLFLVWISNINYLIIFNSAVPWEVHLKNWNYWITNTNLGNDFLLVRLYIAWSNNSFSFLPDLPADHCAASKLEAIPLLYKWTNLIIFNKNINEESKQPNFLLRRSALPLQLGCDHEFFRLLGELSYASWSTYYLPFDVVTTVRLGLRQKVSVEYFFTWFPCVFSLLLNEFFAIITFLHTCNLLLSHNCWMPHAATHPTSNLCATSLLRCVGGNWLEMF